MKQARDSDLFVGRGRELGLLSSAIESARDGSGRAVAIFGEPGIGKTALARTALTIARESGFGVGIGRCREQRDTPPFWPWQQALLAVARVNSDAPDAIRFAAAELSSRHTEGDGSRFTLYRNFVEHVREACERVPVLLLLDDLQWTDEASMDLLEILALDLESIPLVVLGTVRSTEIRDNARLQAALGLLSREPVYSELHLGGLDDSDLGHIFSHLSESEISTAGADLLRSVSGGNPFFVRELASRSSGRPDESLRMLAGSEVPAAIKSMIQQRTKALPEATRDVLRTAALIGEVFQIDRLARTEKMTSSGAVLDLLSPAERLGIIHADEDLNSWRFHHAITRYALADDLLSTERVVRHLAIAESLESEWDEDRPELAAELAFHYGQAELLSGPAPVFKYSLAAGLHAIRTLAFTDAHDHLLRAEKLDFNASAENRAELLDGLSLTYMAIAQNDRAYHYQLAAFDAWLALGNHERAVNTSAHPIPGAGGSYHARVNEMSSQALELAEPGSVLRARALSRAMWVSSAHPERNRPLFEEAVAILAENPDPAAEIWLRGRWAASWVQPRHYEMAISELEKALALSPVAGDPEADVHILFWLAFACGAIGRTDELLRHVEACKRAGIRSRRAMRDFQWARIAVFTYGLLGKFELMDPVFDEIKQMHSETGLNMPSIQIVAWAQQGRKDEARQLLEAHWQELEDLSEGQFGNGPLRFVSVAFATLRYADVTGDRELVPQADAAIREVVSREGGDPETFGVNSRFGLEHSEDFEVPFFIYSFLGNAAVDAANYSPEAINTLERLLSRHRNIVLPDSGGGWLYFPQALDRIVGRLHALAGHPDAAVQRFEDAIAFCTKAGYLPEAAWSCHDYVAYSLDHGIPLTRQKAEETLESGIKFADLAGMPPVKNRMTALKDRLGELPLAGRPRSVHPDGLTEREIEVLRELARGRTNREIAEALIISQNTVIRHVSNILSKTGCANRTEAAAYAERMALV